jgi:hypothetical protein
MAGIPKSPYHFTQYLLGPRHNRTYLDDGGSPIDELMLDLGSNDTPIPVEEYKGLPDYVRQRGVLNDPPQRSFSGPGAHLSLAGETVPRIPPDMLSGDWRTQTPPFVDPATTQTPVAKAEEEPETESNLPKSLTNVYGREIEHLKNYPTLTKPKWWQQALGGAAGFGAGWSNAAGRTKHPIDIGAMQQNIMHPGYSDQVAQWRSGMAPIEAEANIEAARQNAELKSEDIAGRQTQRQAVADWRKRQADPHYNRQQISPEIGQQYGLMPEADGTYWLDKSDVSRIIANMKESPTKPVTVAPGGALVDNTGKVLFQNAPKPQTTGGVIGVYERRYGDKALEMYNADRLRDRLAGRTPPDPNIALLREMQVEDRRNKENEGVGQWKDKEERQLMQDRQAAINHAFTVGPGMPIPTEAEIWADPVKAAKLKAINRQFATRAQAIQNEFVNRAANRGIHADRYTINPDTFEAVRQGGVPPPAAVGQNTPLPPPAQPKALPVRQTDTSVLLPNGKVKHFPSKDQANAFLRAAGVPGVQ